MLLFKLTTYKIISLISSDINQVDEANVVVVHGNPPAYPYTERSGLSF